MNFPSICIVCFLWVVNIVIQCLCHDAVKIIFWLTFPSSILFNNSNFFVDIICRANFFISSNQWTSSRSFPLPYSEGINMYVLTSFGIFMINTKSTWTYFFLKCINGELKVFVRSIKLIQNVTDLFFLYYKWSIINIPSIKFDNVIIY